MPNPAVTLVCVCKVGNAWKRLPVVMGGNGRLRSQYAIHEGKEMHFPGSYYALRSYKDRKTVYETVGSNAADALAAQKREERRARVKSDAKVEGIELVETGDRPRALLQAEKKKWISSLKSRGKLRASETMTISMDAFLHATGHEFVDQITRDSVLTFYDALRKNGNSERTIFNKSSDLAGWFRAMKLDVKELIPKVGYTTRDVEIYSQEEMAALFEACGPGYYRTVYQTLLMSGMREQEAMNLRWVNVDFTREELKIRDHRSSGATIKDRAHRTVPVPDLMPILHEWKKARPGTSLVLGTGSDSPNNKWLESLKRIVRNAGLGCGDCDGCRERNACRAWFLHKFRATFTTNMLRSGLDARTVMSFTGHSDLATVMRYWAPLQAESAKEKIKAIAWS